MLLAIIIPLRYYRYKNSPLPLRSKAKTVISLRERATVEVLRRDVIGHVSETLQALNDAVMDEVFSPSSWSAIPLPHR